ncbi:unnamed protein product [Gordionus sp. m RMFG-2023]
MKIDVRAFFVIFLSLAAYLTYLLSFEMLKHLKSKYYETTKPEDYMPITVNTLKNFTSIQSNESHHLLKSTKQSLPDFEIKFILNCRYKCFTRTHGLFNYFVRKKVPYSTSSNSFWSYIKSIMTNKKSYTENNKHKRSKVYIVAIIHSAIHHLESRKAIRETWGAHSSIHQKNMRLVFILGQPIPHPKDSHTLQNEISTESELYHDIVQGNFIEGHQNLTLKTVTGYKWVSQYCSHAKYVLKIDDDMHVDTFQVLQLLSQFDSLFASNYTDQEFISRINKRLKMNLTDDSISEKPYVQLEHMSENQFNYIIDWNSSIVPQIKHIEESKNGEQLSPTIANDFLEQEILASFGEMVNIEYYQSPEWDAFMASFEVPLLSAQPWSNLAKSFLMCHPSLNHVVVRDTGSKWYATESQYQGNFYEPYCFGWAIITTPDVSLKLYNSFYSRPYFYMDDAHVTGTLARTRNIPLISIKQMFLYDVQELYDWAETAEMTQNVSKPTINISQPLPYLFYHTGKDRKRLKKIWTKTLEAYGIITEKLYKS